MFGFAEYVLWVEELACVDSGAVVGGDLGATEEMAEL